MKRAADRPPFSNSASAQDAVFPEPGLRLLPVIFRGVLAVAAAIVGMEAVRCFRIDLEFGRLPALLERRLELLDLDQGNAGIGTATLNFPVRLGARFNRIAALRRNIH